MIGKTQDLMSAAVVFSAVDSASRGATEAKQQQVSSDVASSQQATPPPTMDAPVKAGGEGQKLGADNQGEGGVLALAAAWCYALGEWHSEEDRSDTAQKARAQGRGDVSSRAKHIATGLRQVRGKTKPRRQTGLFLDKLQIKVGQQVVLRDHQQMLKMN